MNRVDLISVLLSLAIVAFLLLVIVSMLVKCQADVIDQMSKTEVPTTLYTTEDGGSIHG